MASFRILGNDTRNVLHKMINRSFHNRKHIPHEWYFLNLFLRKEMKEDIEIADVLYDYIDTYYPEYRWEVSPEEDKLDSIILEIALHDYKFAMVYQYGIESPTTLKKSMDFGEIVTEFLIRYRNYSLTDVSGARIILTAQSDCEKNRRLY